MKNSIIIAIILLAILAIGTFAWARFLSKNINPGNIVDILKTPQKEIVRTSPLGAKLKFPLTVPDGFRIGIFADLGDGLPRVLAFDPNGTLLVSIPGKGKVVALPDSDGNGQADKVVDVATGLNKPHGITFEGKDIYIAESDKVVRYYYDPETFKISSPKKLFDLPGGGRHVTRTIRIYNGKLYTSVGSSCDVCVETNPLRAAILVSNLDGSDLKVFAKGLRNTVFFTFNREGKMWGVDMGRDFLGDNLPPDEVNVIEESPSTGPGPSDYGWPYCYGKKIRDSKFETGKMANYCDNTESTAFDLPAHVAPLGVLFDEAGDLLVSMHGSWNSTIPVGYKIVKLNTENGKVSGMEDFVAGFIQDDKVLGRPVDLVFDKNGSLFVSDDHAGLIYILTKI